MDFSIQSSCCFIKTFSLCSWGLWEQATTMQKSRLWMRFSTSMLLRKWALTIRDRCVWWSTVEAEAWATKSTQVYFDLSFGLVLKSTFYGEPYRSLREKVLKVYLSSFTLVFLIGNASLNKLTSLGLNLLVGKNENNYFKVVL